MVTDIQHQFIPYRAASRCRGTTMKRNHAHPTLSVAFLRPKQKDAEKIHEKEIEDSIARSHAARVTHKRRAEALHRSFAFQGGSYGQPNDCKPPLLSEPRGLHRHDPFATYAGHDAPTFVFQALDYAREMVFAPIWAPFRPEEISSVQNSWKRASIQHPLIFHAEVANSLNWMRLQYTQQNPFTSELKILQIQHRGLALQILRRDIEANCSVPNLFHAHAIGLLAWANGAAIDYLEPYPLSPMADLGSVYIVSRCNPTPAHIKAYYKIVSLNGGCKQDEVALAQTNEFTDLSISTYFIHQPRFPISRTRRQYVASPHQLDETSSGLATIRGIDRQLYEILIEMRQLTDLVDLYHHRSKQHSMSLVNILVQRRNVVQHDLLAYKSAPYLRSSLEHNSAYYSAYGAHLNRLAALAELTRLAALIYSDMILFPTAWVAGVKQRLAQKIYDIAVATRIFDNLHLETVEFMREDAAAHEDDGQPTKGEHAELQIWILWFSCFAAYQSDLQDFFDHQLGKALEDVYGTRVWQAVVFGGVDFEEARHDLWRILWWGPVCDEPGRALWKRLSMQRETK